MKTQKYCIFTENITGMTHIISGILSDANIDILAMEVVPEKVYIKLHEPDKKRLKILMSQFVSHPNIIKVEPILYLPIEIHQKNLEVILSAIEDIVIAVDLLGNIILFNPVSEKILKDQLHLSNLGKLFGKKNSAITRRILKGESFIDEEILLNISGHSEQFFLSVRALIDEENQLIGSLLTFIPGAEMRKMAFRLQRPELNTFKDIIYKTEIMENAIQRAKQAAKSNAPVMLRGESGTGKELFARAIHNASSRNKMPFVPINCAAIPDSLMESELFGYEPGAFTGAGRKRKLGLIELAEGGSLFLDEVGELPIQIQAKLLRVLQDGKVRRIGGDAQIQVDFRLIAATNKDLEQMLETKQFRADLYYRLNVIPVDIPPLRSRKEDIPVLVDNFMKSFVKRNQTTKVTVSKMAFEKLASRDWFGNVRELENVLERALSQLDKESILMPERLIFDAIPNINKGYFESELKINEIIPLSQIREKAEKSLLEYAASRYKSTRKLAAALKVSHMTIANKLKKYDITL